jgi:hypothetical protein
MWKFLAGVIVLGAAGPYLSDLGQCGTNYNWTCGTMWWLVACIVTCLTSACLSARRLLWP